MTKSVHAQLGTLEVLAAGYDGVVVAAKQGRLFISGIASKITRACGADVSSGHLQQVVAITLDKEAIVLSRLPNEDQWTETARHLLPKRPSAVSFAPGFKQILVADGFGDVYRLPVNESLNVRVEEEQDKCRILGHFSTVTDLAVRDGFVASVDRDDKVRVSRFPDAFIIQSYGLGHLDFVTCVRWVGSDRIVTGSGDGTIRLWSSSDGSQLATISLKESQLSKKSGIVDPNAEIVITSIEMHPENEDLAVVCCYKNRNICLLSGLQSTTAPKVASFVSVDERDVVTGVGFDAKAVLWVSTSANENTIRSFTIEEVSGSCHSFKPGVRKLLDSAADVVEEEELPKKEGSDGVWMRYEWLNDQRKKEMVEDWKGKKRRRVEI